MPSLGLGELLLVGIILLLVVGPERLPHATRTLGRAYGRMRRAADELRRALVLEADRLDEELRLKELRELRLKNDQARKPAPGGAKAQPEAPVGEPSDAPGTDDAGVQIPPGFSEQEWSELPPHIREIVARRQERS